MKYYIKDPNSSNVMKFKTYDETVLFLEKFCTLKFKKTRAEYMNEAVAIGYSPDDREATQFVRLMSEAVEVGVIRENSLMRTDITSIERYNKPEFGDGVISPRYK